MEVVLHRGHGFSLLNDFLEICYFSFSSVQPIQTAIMRAELHRRGIAQMRVSDCVLFRMLYNFPVSAAGVYDIYDLHADQQSVASRHVYIWRSFACSYYYRRTRDKCVPFCQCEFRLPFCGEWCKTYPRKWFQIHKQHVEWE
jgi:hypothetical protein